MIQDKIFLDEKDPTGLSYNTPFTVYGSYQGRLWSKTPSGSIQYYSQNSDLSAYATTGSNQFNGSQTITGSLTVTGGISGSSAESASYALNADKIDNLDSTQLVLTSSFNSYTSSASSSVGSLSSSVATTTSGLGGRITTIEGNYATTGSNIFLGSQVITGSICSNGNIVTTGQIVAQTINVQQVTSSIVYSCGSNIFGNSVSNTQQFTGSILATGSLTLTGPMIGSSTVCGVMGNFSCVGIGTTSPAFSLNVYGTNPATVYQTANTGTGAANGFYVGHTGDVSYIWNYNNYPIVFATCNNEKMRIGSDGTKYFGTYNGSRIQVSASGENLYQYTNGYYIYGLFNDANSLSIESAFAGCIIFRTAAQTTSSSPTTATERMRIMHNGSVIMQSSLGICNGGAINMTIPNGNNGGSIRMVCCTGANEGDMFFTGGGGVGILIAGSGKIGIGTTTPQSTLHIGPSLNSVPSCTSIAVPGDTSIRFMAGSDGNANYGSYIAGTQYSGVRALSLGYRQGAGDILTMTVTQLSEGIGGVGIGTSTPSYPLDVNGIIGAKNILRLNSSTTTSVSTSATTISTGSNTYGGLAIVWGSDASGNIWTDLLFYSLGQVFVIRSQDVSGGPFGRTYSVNGSGALRLAMGGGTYTVRYQALLTS